MGRLMAVLVVVGVLVVGLALGTLAQARTCVDGDKVCSMPPEQPDFFDSGMIEPDLMVAGDDMGPSGPDLALVGADLAGGGSGGTGGGGTGGAGGGGGGMTCSGAGRA